MFILPRYVLRIFWGPLILGFLVIVFVLLNQFLIKEVPTWLSKDVPLKVVWDLISVYLASIVALAIPMAILVATLMTFGQLSQDNEITAMKATGYGVHRALMPVFIVSLLIAYGDFRFINDVLPDQNFKARKLIIDINVKKPSLQFQDGIIFSDDELIKNYRLLFKKIDRASNWIYGVTIWDFSNPEWFRTLLAEKGTLVYNEQMHQIVMNLYNVEMHDIEVKDFFQYQYFTFERQKIRINVEPTIFQQGNIDNRTDRDMTLAMMRKEIADYETQIKNYKDNITKTLPEKIKKASPEIENFLVGLNPEDFGDDSEKGSYIKKRMDDPAVEEINNNAALVNRIRSDVISIYMFTRLRNKFLVEVHKKYALPFACIIFVLIGAPLGVRARRGGIAVGTGLSIMFFLIYYAFLTGGEQLGDRGIMPPWLAMWSANIIIGALGITLTAETALEKGLFISSLWEHPFLNWLIRKK